MKKYLLSFIFAVSSLHMAGMYRANLSRLQLPSHIDRIVHYQHNQQQNHLPYYEHARMLPCNVESESIAISESQEANFSKVFSRFKGSRLWRWSRNAGCAMGALGVARYLERQRLERNMERPETYTGQVAKIVREKRWQDLDDQIMQFFKSKSVMKGYTIGACLAKSEHAKLRFQTLAHRKGLVPVDKNSAIVFLQKGVEFKDADIIDFYIKHVDKNNRDMSFIFAIEHADISSGIVAEQDAQILKKFCNAGASCSTIFTGNGLLYGMPGAPLIKYTDLIVNQLDKLIECTNDPWLREKLICKKKEGLEALEEIEQRRVD